MTVGSEGSSLQPSASGVTFRSIPAAWAYIGRMSLDAGCIEGGGWIAVDLSVTKGMVGVGVLDQAGDDFLVQRSATTGNGTQTVFLRLDSFAAAGDLILRNWDGEFISEGVLRAVRVAVKDGSIPPACNQALTCTQH